MADEVVRVLTDATLRQRLSQAALSAADGSARKSSLPAGQRCFNNLAAKAFEDPRSAGPGNE